MRMQFEAQFMDFRHHFLTYDTVDCLSETVLFFKKYASAFRRFRSLNGLITVCNSHR